MYITAMSSVFNLIYYVTQLAVIQINKSFGMALICSKQTFAISFANHWRTFVSHFLQCSQYPANTIYMVSGNRGN